MITQGSYRLEIDTTSTTDWVASQQIAPSPSTGTSRTQPPQSPAQPLSARSFESGGSRPLIKPIRGFKPSSRKSTEMAMRRPSGETDNTLRALEGYDRPRRISDPSSQEEPASDDSDMFLRAAKEEELSRRASNAPFGALARSNSKGSRGAAQRSSLPPSSTLFQSSISHRRGSDHDSSSIRGIDDQGNGNVGQVLTYRPEKDRTSTALGDVNRNRFYGSTTRSPTTPRGLTSREPSIESTAYQGRRGSLPDPSSVLPSRPSSYRQSNLSYSTPRNYNSSPLVSRATDMQEAPAPETIRAAEGTESTVSTTAPSTVWDELEDLKSRIHRLELTGKLPPTSGAAMSRASHDRPPTATTTVTTMSTSPKQRGSGNSVSPVEAINKQVPPSELHPLLHAALAKSKPLLAPEVFSTLEATASDALAIASMMGTSGQPGPMSSAQSTIDRPTSTVSDRQVRRKADSMCRSLTELCIALSYGKTEHASSTDSQTAVGPRSRDTEVRPSIEQGNVPRLPMGNELARIKASPRALSRLEARRSSLLNTTTLPSPRYAPSETGTPTQTSMAGRRTSLYIRSRRANTEEPEEQDETRFRVPSRAITEIGRFKNTQREYLEEPLPEKTTTVQSALPVRRQGHIATSSLPNAAQSTTTAQSSIGGRRYLDRGTPERDTTGPIGRLVEERGPPKPSIGQGFGLGRAGSLNRRKREQTNSVDYSSASQNYQ
ncbi:hypothetical protein BJ875DRAFT_365032 [Amylocarpus encephaloides]|uniref:LPXTG-motif cell wall anchor domain protein n=1 Tax=Amylocarpus encephaloides TaxID=45428 RepID=A0A9P7YUR9_9HELO|nr:hypothetical protein BJ875DRAFT_365032 [Amylocarpus encephaloides]